MSRDLRCCERKMADTGVSVRSRTLAAIENAHATNLLVVVQSLSLGFKAQSLSVRISCRGQERYRQLGARSVASCHGSARF